MALTKVSTDGVKDDAITSGKIPANAVGTSELADNAVDTNAIANNAVTAGKTSGVQTTINNNADNRVITGSGTANTLEGESGLIYSSNELTVTEQITVDAPDNVTSIGGDYALKLQGGDANNDIVNLRFATDADGSLAQVSAIAEITGSYPNSSGSLVLGVQAGGAIYEGMRINSARKIGIGTENPHTYAKVTVNDSNGISLTGSTQTRIVMQHANGGTNLKNFDIQTLDGNLRFRTIGDNNTSVTERLRIQSGGGISFNGDTAAANALDDYEEGNWTPVPTESGNNLSTSHATGRYVKIGAQVFAYWRIDLDTTSAGGHLILTGFPFANSSTVPATGGTAKDYQTYDVEDGPIYHYPNNQSNLQFYKNSGQNFNANNGSGKSFRGCTVFSTA